jgi:hypothetical protein
MLPNDSGPRAFSIKSFCAAYGVGRTKTYKEIAVGRLKARKVGNRTLILAKDAEAWERSLPSAAKHDTI